MRWLIILALILFASACNTPEPPLRIGTNVWPGYEPLYLARSLGLLQAEDARLIEYTSASQVIGALEDGTIDAAALTLDEVLLVRQRDIPLKLVLVMDYSAGADKLLVKPDITELRLLGGRKIGVEDTALGAYMLQRALDHAGLRLADIVVVPLEIHRHEQAYLNGEIDAVVTFEPVASRLLAAGAVTLFDSSRIPGEIMDVLAVRSNNGLPIPNHLPAVLAAWFGALDYQRTHPQQAAETMSARLGLTAAQTLAAFGGVVLPSKQQNRDWLLTAPSLVAQQAERIERLMVDKRLLADSPVTSLLDESWLKELY